MVLEVTTINKKLSDEFFHIFCHVRLKTTINYVIENVCLNPIVLLKCISGFDKCGDY